MFRKSSRCESHTCLEVDGLFVRSSRCTDTTCIEVGRPDGSVLIRDSKLDAMDPMLRVSPAAWTAFTATLKV